MKTLLVISLMITAMSCFAQEAFVSVGTCVMEGEANEGSMRILTSEMDDAYNKPNNGLFVAEVPSPEGKGTIMTAYTMTIKRVGPKKIAAQTPYGMIYLIDGQTTTITSQAGKTLCTRDN